MRHTQDTVTWPDTVTSEGTVGGPEPGQAPGAAARRPWLRRSSVVAGSVASLAAGALLGGIFEGVHALLPSASTESGPTLAHPGGAVPWQLADAVMPAAASRSVPAPTRAVASSVAQGLGAATAGASGGSPGAASLVPTGSSSPAAGPVSGSGSASPVPVTGGASGPLPAGGGASCPLCVDGASPSLPVGSVPVAGPVLSTVTQTATGAADQILGTADQATAPVTSTVGSATGSSSSGITIPVSGVGTVTVGGSDPSSGTSVTVGPITLGLG